MCDFLKSQKYKPYYKWAFKGLDDCIVLNDLKELIKELTELPHQYSAWDNNHLLVNIVVAKRVEELEAGIYLKNNSVIEIKNAVEND